MKRKIKVFDDSGYNEGEIEVPNKMHFDIQLKYRCQKTKNKKKYSRKEKYKKEGNTDDLY